MFGITSEYLHDILDVHSLKRIISRTTTHLKPFAKDFQAIAFRGMSGAIVAPTVACRLNKEIIVVRKKGLNAHSSLIVEGSRNIKNYIIIDDFVCEGATVVSIQEEIKKFCPKAKCIGLYMYMYSNMDCDAYKLINQSIKANLFKKAAWRVFAQ